MPSLSHFKWSPMIFALVIFSCGKVENSSTTDPSAYSADAGSAKFVAASAVLKKYCIRCHSFAGLSEAELIAARSPGGLLYIQPRSIETSLLYTRIRGNLSGNVGDMPKNESLTAAEIVKIQDWILSL